MIINNFIAERTELQQGGAEPQITEQQITQIQQKLKNSILCTYVPYKCWINRSILYNHFQLLMTQLF